MRDKKRQKNIKKICANSFTLDGIKILSGYFAEDYHLWCLGKKEMMAVAEYIAKFSGNVKMTDVMSRYYYGNGGQNDRQYFKKDLVSELIGDNDLFLSIEYSIDKESDHNPDGDKFLSLDFVFYDKSKEDVAKFSGCKWQNGYSPLQSEYMDCNELEHFNYVRKRDIARYDVLLSAVQDLGVDESCTITTTQL